MKLTKTILLFSAVAISSLCSCSVKRSISKDKWKELAEKCSYEQSSSATITVSMTNSDTVKETYVYTDKGWEADQTGSYSSILYIKANTFSWPYFENSTIYYFDNLSTKLTYETKDRFSELREEITVSFNKKGFVSQKISIVETVTKITGKSTRVKTTKIESIAYKN